ncbi:hypothetical protein [Brevundimonas sp. FT23042]|uniref:hypothetical protein n=1 Tax=Brevundimonas sp. FT23042 TaxID=3393749 RepID=UPI003B587CB9
MQIVAPRRTLTLAAACLIGAGVLIQWLLGYRLNAGSAPMVEILALVLYGAAIVLMTVPQGRGRPLMAAGLGFILMCWAVHLNARLSVFLETEAGGQVIAAHRILLATLFAAPLCGLIVGVIAGVLVRGDRIRFTPKGAA